MPGNMVTIKIEGISRLLRPMTYRLGQEGPNTRVLIVGFFHQMDIWIYSLSHPVNGNNIDENIFRIFI